MNRRIAILLLVLLAASPGFAASCETLITLKLPQTTISSAQLVPEGSFRTDKAAFKGMPAFCRVAAEIKPSPDSDIKIEIWMPLSGWNGKYQGTGNGGFAGEMEQEVMAGALRRGYATAGTDTGHTGAVTDAGWALHHPERVVDFAYRAIHEMTMKAKLIIQAFYARNPRHSYFAACSDGGREALMEAQRFPADYDGIIAGAPANYWTHLLAAGVWDLQALMSDPAGYIPTSKIPAISAAVLAACDAQDGVKDGIVNNPPQCRFDPTTMLCQGGDSTTCLTGPQVTALKKIYAGPRNSQGQQIFPGYSPGGEEGPRGWSDWITGESPGKSRMFIFSNGFFSNMVFESPSWDLQTFNFDRDVERTDTKLASTLNATDPNLREFKARGGKLLIYHGWSDAAIPARNSIDYYNSVLATMGASEVKQFLRLYLAPGVQHCVGGPGANSFNQFGLSPTEPRYDLFAALEEWVERSLAPDEIIATKYVEDDRNRGIKMTRPLCPYPQVASYKGFGDTNDARSFICAAGKD